MGPQAVHVLREGARSGIVLVGGGLTEVHLADTLANRAVEVTRGNTSPAEAVAGRAALAVAECLRDVAACLAADRARPELTASTQACGPRSALRGDFLDAARAAVDRLREDTCLDAASVCASGVVLEAEGPKKAALLG